MKRSITWSSRHKDHILFTLQKLRDESWSFNYPVFLLNRSWLRLEQIKLSQLQFRLPPDNSNNAPELVKYHKLVEKGINPIIAIQECWIEFGMEDFYRALRKSWKWKDRGNNGWTFDKYIQLIKHYEASNKGSKTSLPLIVLAEPDSKKQHELIWIKDYEYPFLEI